MKIIGRFNIPKLSKLSLESIKGIGPQFATALHSKDIQSIEDLFCVLPKSYEDRTTIHEIKNLRAGQKANVFGKIIEAYIAYFKKSKKSIFEIVIDDGTGKLKATWFNFNRKYVKSVFKKGSSIFISGDISLFPGEELQCIHPEVDFMKEEEIKKREKILPKYRDLGIFPKIHRKALFNIIDTHLDPHVDDRIPKEFLPLHLPLNIYDTFKDLHFPREFNEKTREIERLKYSEIFYYLLGLRKKRTNILHEKTYQLNVNRNRLEEIITALPFQLTDDQKNALHEIISDFDKPHPMSRILIGDVGSGKTIVAMLAAASIIEMGYQVALLAPTQLLAYQHREYIRTYFPYLENQCVLLTGNVQNKNQILESIRTGFAKCIIGTHALLSENNDFQKLAMLIIDEEHKFGVVQKELLIKKNALRPHCLSLSATPIPRSIGEIIYADKDISLINKRALVPKVSTSLFYESEEMLYTMIRQKIEEGAQAYIVLPRINEDKKTKSMSITQYADHIQECYFTDFKIGLLHGEQSDTENIRTLEAFQKQKIDIIVATSMIEVGIHNENAQALVVIHPESFGLIQLHQLRGRIGRGEKEGECFLVINEDISQDSLERLKILEAMNDGFALALEDYKRRGMGELEGLKQSGFPDFRFFDLRNDMTIMEGAKQNVDKLLLLDPQLSSHPGIAKTLEERWQV